MSGAEWTDLQKPLLLPRSGSYSDPRRNGEAVPIVYGDCTVGGSGGVWNCPCIDQTNYVYAAAAHPLLTVAQGNSVTVYDSDNQEISAAGYTFNPAHDFESQGEIATLTFTADQSDKEPLSVRAKGKAEGGSLVENPVAVVKDFLTAWAGVGEEEFDGDWSTRVQTHLDGLGLTLAGVIVDDGRPDLLVSEMLRLMVSWWRAGSGLLVFRPHLGPGGVLESDVVVHLGGKSLDSDRLKIIFDEDQICTRAAVSHGYNRVGLKYEEFDDGESQAALDMEARYGKVYLRQFKLPWVRSASTVGKLQELIVSNYGRAPILLQSGLKGNSRIHLEQGDVVSVSVDWLLDENLNPLRNQLHRLVSVNCALEERGSGWIEAVDLKVFLTQAYPADGTLEAGGPWLAGGQRDTTQYA